PYTVTFQGMLANANVPQMTTNSGGLVGGTIAAATIQNGNGNELQQLAFGGTPSGGTFTISFAGRTTAAISSGATAATVQTALQAITTVGSGNVQVLGGPVSGANPTLLLKFAGGLANSNLAQATVSNSLTGVTS